MAQHNRLGQAGEDQAVALLQEKGYEILARNWHSSHKELDIVARNRDWLVVVEVKTRSSEDYSSPGRPSRHRKSGAPSRLPIILSGNGASTCPSASTSFPWSGTTTASIWNTSRTPTPPRSHNAPS